MMETVSRNFSLSEVVVRLCLQDREMNQPRSSDPVDPFQNRSLHDRSPKQGVVIDMLRKSPVHTMIAYGIVKMSEETPNDRRFARKQHELSLPNRHTWRT